VPKLKVSIIPSTLLELKKIFESGFGEAKNLNPAQRVVQNLSAYRTTFLTIWTFLAISAFNSITGLVILIISNKQINKYLLLSTY